MNATKEIYLTNAFSLNMLANPNGANIKITEMDAETARLAYTLSAIGHEDTANVIGSVFGKHVPMNRATVSLEKGDKVIVAQYIGPRLPEGSTTLPEGATIKFFQVSVN